MPEHPAESLRGNPSLAIAEPAGIHPVVNDVARVVTNHATGIRHPDLTPVLEVRALADRSASARTRRRVQTIRAPHDRRGRPVLLAVAGAVANGRLLAVGDASIVMNSMLRYAGNKMFARNLLHYAADDGDRRRERGTPQTSRRAARPGRDRESACSSSRGASSRWATFGEDPEAGARGATARRCGTRSRPCAQRASRRRWRTSLRCSSGSAIVVWTGSRAGRTHKAAAPRFTRAVAARRSKGASRGTRPSSAHARTPRLLAMLELKSALEEELCDALGMDENPGHEPGHEALTSALASRRLVAPEVLAQLRSLLLRMAQVETMMLSQRSGATMAPVRDREVLAASGEVGRIVARRARGVARARRRSRARRRAARRRDVSAVPTNDVQQARERIERLRREVARDLHRLDQSDRHDARRAPRARARAARGGAGRREDDAGQGVRHRARLLRRGASSSRPTSCPPTSPAPTCCRRATARSRCAPAPSSPTSSSPTRSTARRPRRSRALLEAMQERQVTIEGDRFELPGAVPRPRDAEPDRPRGDLPAARGADRSLPRARRDGLPDARAKRRRCSRRTASSPRSSRPVLDARDVTALQAIGARVHVEDDLHDYAVAITGFTRTHPRVALGASPRATLALVQAAKAWALIGGRAVRGAGRHPRGGRRACSPTGSS